MEVNYRLHTNRYATRSRSALVPPLDFPFFSSLVLGDGRV